MDLRKGVIISSRGYEANMGGLLKENFLVRRVLRFVEAENGAIGIETVGES